MEIGQVRGSPICLRHGHRHVHRNVRISLSTTTTTTPTLLSTKSENSMFILGLGFVGQTLARKLQNQGWLDNIILLILFLCFIVLKKFIFFLLGWSFLVGLYLGLVQHL
jgi:hypothetical protein